MSPQFTDLLEKVNNIFFLTFVAHHCSLVLVLFVCLFVDWVIDLSGGFLNYYLFVFIIIIIIIIIVIIIIIIIIIIIVINIIVVITIIIITVIIITVIIVGYCMYHVTQKCLPGDCKSSS